MACWYGPPAYELTAVMEWSYTSKKSGQISRLITKKTRQITVVWLVPNVERRSLETLRYDSNVVARGQRRVAGFNDIDFRRRTRIASAGVVFAFASTGGQSHSGKIVDAVARTLVRGDASIALVVVTIRPHAVAGGSKTRPPQVAHGPEAWPETNSVSAAGQRDGGFQVAAFEAELVPGLQHARPVVEVVVYKGVETNV